jgi:two-component system LytT family response regulator
VTRPLRVVAVDDEPPARARLLALLGGRPGVEVAASVDNAEAALDIISQAANSAAPVDVVFLDVQMPEMDGFAMLEALDALALCNPPAVVFVTAHDEYALRAFDAQAIDYLLKPYSDERFETAFSRAARMVRAGDTAAAAGQLQAALAALAPRPADHFLDRLAVRERGRVRLIPVSDIRWISAEGVYVTVHTGAEQHLHREVLSRLEAQLDPRQFIRIHRSHIVNFGYLRELVQDAHGEFEALLAGSVSLKVGRMYRSKIEDRIRQRL